MHWRFGSFYNKTIHSVQNGLTALIAIQRRPSCISALSSIGPMNAAQIRCPGCKKFFTINGYSQHVAKTRRVGCRAVHMLESSLFQTGPAATSEPLADLGSVQGLPNALLDATRGPADHQAHIIGHNIDSDVSVPCQARTNGTVFLDLVMTATC